MSLKLEQLSAKCKQQVGDVPLSASIHCERKFIISTLAENVLGSLVPDADECVYLLSPCTLEQFDANVMLPAANAVSHGYKRVL